MHYMMRPKELQKTFAAGDTIVMVAKDKHADDYYLALTEDDVYAIALHILQQRLDNGYIYTPNDKYKPKPPSLNEDQRKSLPAGAVKDAAEREYREYKSAMIRWENELTEWQEVQDALEQKDGKLAYGVLMGRNGEYEEIEMSVPWTVKRIKEHENVSR